MISRDTLLEQLKQRTVSEYAPPMLRAVVGAADLVVLTVIQFLVAAVLGKLFAPAGVTAATPALDMLFSPVAITTVTLLYFPIAWATTGRTLVMRVFGLRVVDADSLSRIGLRTALLRFSALLVALLPLGAGFVVAAKDPKHQGWHDRTAGTVVVPE
jgi:uncharacterized RDD family membrane protein YckC